MVEAEAKPEGALDGALGHAGTSRIEPTTAPRWPWREHLRRLVDIPTDARAIAALDGMRGIAASLVFVVHFQAAFGPLLSGATSTAADYAALVGYHGVNVFFVLSGYLIYGSLMSRPTPFGTYVWRRLRRIYPTFLAVLLLYLTVGRLVPGRIRLPSTDAATYVLQNVLLLPGVFPVTPIITVAWSLSYEVFFYLGIAAIVMGLRLRHWPARYRIALFASAIVAWVVGGRDAQRAVGSFVMFLPGILTWEASRTPAADLVRARVPSWVVWTALAATLLLIPAFDLQPIEGALSTIGATPAVLGLVTLGVAVPLLLLHALGRTGGGVSRRLGWAPLRVVGVISYSFYLIHGATINALALLFWRFADPGRPNGPLLYLALLPVVYVASIIVSLALFRTVEQRLSL